MRRPPSSDRADALSTSDDWPFLYLHGRLIPDLTLRSLVILGLLGLGMVWFFMPRGRIALDSRMFFLGAAFMLLETRAVAQMALLFGSTWLVNSSVFFTILVLILLANLYIIKAQNIDLRWHYLGLAAFLVAGAFVPLDVFLTGGVLWRYVAPCFLALKPGVLRRRHLRALFPQRAAAGIRDRLEHRWCRCRRICRSGLDALGLPAPAVGRSGALSALSVDAARAIVARPPLALG